MAEKEDSAALKEIFNRARIRHIATELAAVYPGCDTKAFQKACLAGLDELSVMQRMRQVAEALHGVLPDDFRAATAVLRRLAPRLDSGFVTMALAEYAACYGAEDFDESVDALKFLTTFGSSEFAIRHLLQRDLRRTLKVMQRWSRDQDEHVRRLASEGCRPRLPWAARIPPLLEDPALTRPILDRLRADPSAYVRKSVANHLNDITKDHPDWVLDLVGQWPRDNPHTAWIIRHALRSLVKQGNPRALAMLGAGDAAEVTLHALRITPAVIRLGQDITLSFQLDSTSAGSQRLVIDYAIHYVKKSGAASAKVFKLKTFDLAARESVRLRRVQPIRDFTTRTHYAGRHEVDILVNGRCLARTAFTLET